MKTIIEEGLAKINIENKKIVSKEMEVFYNPAMSLNRDISVLLLNSLDKKNLQIADPLAASGVRSIRFLKELNKNKIKKIYINDYNKDATKLIKENFALNKIQYKNNPKIIIQNQDANIFLLNSTGFDYIDIDPFGTPNPFLDAACKRLARNGILAVTATDTSALCGTAPKACLRKYWAMPKKDAIMHETGLRILVRKVQLAGAQYYKALFPIFSYSKEHYVRVFFRNDKGKTKADDILKQHGMFNGTGPMWLGGLWDKSLVDAMYRKALKSSYFSKNKELIKFLKTIKEESKINAVGFYDLHDICSKNNIKSLLKREEIMEKIRKSGYKACETHFSGHSLRSDIPCQKLVGIMKINKFL